MGVIVLVVEVGSGRDSNSTKHRDSRNTSGMDISTPRRPVPLPAAGDIRLIVENGYIRAVDSNGRKIRLQAEAGIPVQAVAASLSTNLTGNNNDLVFTARRAGVAGNTISISYVNPGAETASESVAVDGNNIVVTLRSVSSVLSTAAQVKAAIEASAAATALVSVANKAANDGTGAVIAMAVTFLSGGVDATEGSAGDMMYDPATEDIYFAREDVGKTSTTGWMYFSAGAL